VARFGSDIGPDAITAEPFAARLGGQWGGRAPSTWNVSLDAIRSAAAYWDAAGLGHRRSVADAAPPPGRSRADVEALLTREDIDLRERTLWRMLYEAAARSAEVLRHRHQLGEACDVRRRLILVVLLRRRACRVPRRGRQGCAHE